VLTRDGVPVSVTPKAVDTLLVLLQHAGRLVRREQLMKEVWPDTFVGEDSLTRNISALRRALSQGTGEPELIETVSKRGYRFTGVVREVIDATAPPQVFRSPEPAIAVLPFATIGATGEEQYLAAGVADALVSRLTKVRGLLVRPMTAIFLYTGADDDLSSIRTQLRVTLVLRGTIRRDRDQIRVSAQLVSLEREAVLWAETFSARFTDLFSMEDAIAAQVAAAIVPRVAAALPAPAPRPMNQAAYAAYLRGRHSWNRSTAEAYHQAVAEYRASIEIDSSYARAHAGLADCYNMMGFWWVMPPKTAFPLAEDYAGRALALDDSLGEAHVSLAWARLHYHYDRAGAEAMFKRGLELNPGYVTGHQWYGLFFAQDGRFDRAFEEIRAALAIDPMSMVVNYNLGVLYMLTRQLDAAIAQFEHTLEIDPTYFMAYAHMGLSYALKGDAAQAFALSEQVSQLSDPVVNLTGRAMFEAMLGNADGARATLAEFERLRGDRLFLPIMVGQVYAALGDADAAMAYLEADYEIRDNWLMWVKVNPVFDPIRHDPRLQALVARIGLAS
jgi:TolB-like protein